MLSRAFKAETAVAPGVACVAGSADQGAKVGAGSPLGIYPADTMAMTKEIGEHITLQLLGPCKALAGGAIEAGDWVKAGTDGKLLAVGTTAGAYECVGYALEDASSGEYFDLFVQRAKVTIPTA
jgi:hypothetical protein